MSQSVQAILVTLFLAASLLRYVNFEEGYMASMTEVRDELLTQLLGAARNRGGLPTATRRRCSGSSHRHGHGYTVPPSPTEGHSPSPSSTRRAA